MHDVSIIIPVYCKTDESLDWLGECLESACKQDCEIVVYDDGSPSDVRSILRNFGKSINEYHVGSVNRGVAFARNRAAEKSTKSLLFPLDCDDRIREGAITKLLGKFDGITPVYPDICKFGNEYIGHYNLLEFDCRHIVTHVGFTSVNVLQLRDQWKSLKGWNEYLEYYEDGEYNARLFSQWCAVRVPEPLIEYRQHDNQRTVKYRKQSAAYARRVLAMIRSLDMSKCCGGKRKVVSNIKGSPAPVAEIDLASMPGEIDGRVLSQYVGGKGKGKHYYQGLGTKFSYKVVYKDYVYADPSDVRSPEDTSKPHLLIQVHKTEPEMEKVEVTTTPVKKKVSRAPVKDIQRNPLDSEFPEINDMTVTDIIAYDPDSNTATIMLAMEKRGKNRKKAISFLSKRAG